MKKRDVVLAFVITMLLVFSSCSGKKETTQAASTSVQGDGKTELTVWCWTQDFNLYAIREANKVYQANHPNVNVTPIEVPWDEVQAKIIAAISAKQTQTLPDIILMQDSAAQKNIITFPGAFYDMTNKVDFSKFTPYKVAVSTVNGRHYGMPFDSGVGATFLRRDMIEKAGLSIDDFNDITWDQFIELGKRVKTATGSNIMALGSRTAEIVTMMLQSSGEWYFKNDGTLNITDNRALRAAIDTVIKINQAGIATQPVDWNEYTGDLVKGNIAGDLNAAWMISIITAAKDQSGKWGAAKFPRLAGFPNARNSTSNGGSGWLVIASSPNAETAVDFLDKTFNNSVAFYDTILPSSGAIATWLPAAQSPIYSQPVEFFGNQVLYADIVRWGNDVPPAFTGLYIYETQDEIAKAIDEIKNGMSIDRALKTAEDTIKFIIQ
jgi:lactose/L-arabinose transport system substrate-binding protein